jgi:DNA repair protein RecO (recombination protein O)
MYKIVTTFGLVVGKRGLGEANTQVTVLSEDLGLIRASARSARLERSKLRYGLEPLTRGRFSLVRGRHEWKLVGSSDLRLDCFPAHSSLIRTRAGKIAKLLVRLMPGEEPVPDLYKVVVEGLQALARSGEESLAESIECMLVLRILSSLGYLPQTEALAPFIEADFFSLELASEVAASRKMLVRTNNESLKATGL